MKYGKTQKHGTEENMQCSARNRDVGTLQVAGGVYILRMGKGGKETLL